MRRDDEERHDLFVLTHDRPRLLRGAVQSVLRELTNRSEILFQVAVVSSSELPAPPPPPFEIIHRPDLQTAVAKRRFVIENSSATWVWLLDDDCRLAIGALQTLLSRIAEHPRRDRLGAVYPRLRFTGNTSLAFRAAERAGLTAGMSWLFGASGEFRWGPSALVVMRRSAALEVGAFRLGSFNVPAGGEDVDLGRRLEKAGWERIACPEASVLHVRDTWATFTGNLRRARAYGWAEGELIRIHSSDVVHAASRERGGGPRPRRAAATRHAARTVTVPTVSEKRAQGRRLSLVNELATHAYACSYGAAYRLGRFQHAIRYGRLRSLSDRFNWTGAASPQ